MEITPEQFKEWIEVLTPYGIGGVVGFVLILYREAVIHLFKRVVDLIFKKKD